MRIYPPYTKWKVELNDPVAFRVYLKNRIEYHNTNRHAPLVGKLKEDGFIARTRNRYNQHIPNIHGTISKNESGSQNLTLTIESNKTIPTIVSVFSIILIVMSIIDLNPLILLAIPAMAIWFGFVSWIFYLMGLHETKVALFEILEEAKK